MMNLLKEVLANQVYPAMGCTEPVSVALCAAHAAKALGQAPQKAVFKLDAGTYKNGMGVRIPNTEGEKGNLLAGAMGLLIAKPELNMEILSGASKEIVARAKELLARHCVSTQVAPGVHGFYVECELKGKKAEKRIVLFPAVIRMLRF